MHKKTQVPNLYFQKQSTFSSQCGVCALNNLLGQNVFNSKKLTQMCHNLSDQLINPYKSVFGGDYDVTVLINALRQYQLYARWLKNSQKISQVVTNKTNKGFLINIQQKKSVSVFLKKLVKQSGRHWVCLKNYGDFYILLDSLKSQSEYLTLQIAQMYLQTQRKSGSTLLVIQLQQK